MTSSYYEKIDDGTVEAVVKAVIDEGFLLEVTKASKEKGIKIKTEKGVNFPDLDIDLNILTDKDLEDLNFIKSKVDEIYIQDTPDFKKEEF